MPTTWRDLPVELQLELAGLTTELDRTRRPNSFGYPMLPDLNARYLNIWPDIHGKLERISREYLHIRIRGCGCWTNEGGHLGEHVFDNFVRNRRYPHMADVEALHGLNLSVLEIELMCDTAAEAADNTDKVDGSADKMEVDEGSATKTKAVKVLPGALEKAPGSCKRNQVKFGPFIAEPDMTITLYGLLANYVSETFRMEIKTNTRYAWSEVQAVRILNNMRRLLCNIYVTPDSTFPPTYNRRRFANDVGRRVMHPKELVLTFEAHLDTLAAAVQQGIPLEQLVSGILLYKGTVDTEDLQQDMDLMRWGIWPPTRKYVLELGMDATCAVVQGVAFYMLSRPLHVIKQAHFHVNSDLGLGKLELTLDYIDMAIWTYDELVRLGMPHPGMGWLAPLLFARAMFLVAWARLSTLHKSPIEGRIFPDAPLPPGVEVQHVGDNTDEVFYSSAWGTSKSMMLVAQKDVNRIKTWSRTLVPGSEFHQDMITWTASLDMAIGMINHVQRRKGHHVPHTVAVNYLNVSMANAGSRYRFIYLQKKGPARLAKHAQMEADFWQMD